MNPTGADREGQSGLSREGAELFSGAGVHTDDGCAEDPSKGMEWDKRARQGAAPQAEEKNQL